MCVSSMNACTACKIGSTTAKPLFYSKKVIVHSEFYTQQDGIGIKYQIGPYPLMDNSKAPIKIRFHRIA